MNAVSALMEKHQLATVSDLLKDSALLGTLSLSDADLAFLKDVPRHSAQALENALHMMEVSGKGAFRDTWKNL
jgi:hypothetical protein